MKDKLNIHYDEEGDLLEIQVGKPTPSYYDEIEDGVFKRIDEKTGKIKGFAVFSFRKRMHKNSEIMVKIPVKIQLRA